MWHHPSNALCGTKNHSDREVFLVVEIVHFSMSDDHSQSSPEPPCESYEEKIEAGLAILKETKGLKYTVKFLERQSRRVACLLHLQSVRERLVARKMVGAIEEIIDNTTVSAWFYLDEAYPRKWGCSAKIAGYHSHATLDVSSSYDEGGGETTLTLGEEEFILDTCENVREKALELLGGLGYYDVPVNQFLFFLALLGQGDGFLSYVSESDTWTETAPCPAPRKKSARSAK